MKQKIKGIWFIGASGSGKTYASKFLKRKIKNCILIDGDEVRKYVSKDLKYNKTDRVIQTKRILGFSKICIKQKIFPIISTSYLSKKIADILNKNSIKIYEVSRDKKFLFKKIKSKKNVVGIDIFFEDFKRENLINDKTFKNKINNILKLLRI
tara:strand:+ start:2652 stop:3110 length:459 start_codon:yes stop_codon:yes gene_type:complete